MSKTRKKETTEKVVNEAGPWEKAVRTAAEDGKWQVRILPPLMTEGGTITVRLNDDIEVVCNIPRGGIIDDNHWKALARQAGVFFESVTIANEWPV